MAVHTQRHGSAQHASGNLMHMLRCRAGQQPDRPIFVYLLDGQSEQAVLTYAQLDLRARAIAARLQEMGLAGRHVLLAYPPGIDFISAFFGCLYAGCVAVPSFPPHRHRALDRFHVIAADAGARIALSTASATAQYNSLIESENDSSTAFSQLSWLATDSIPDALAEQWEEPSIDPGMLAMLQYTSGSTSQPRGVMLSHANLMDNTCAIERAFEIDSRDIAVFWLPLYHDMGLVGGVLTPLFTGAKTFLMSPAAFLQNPFTWLAAISTCRASISGGPNFAYDLCSRMITPEQKAALDLSSWKLAFCGAEPIQAATLERFAASFAACGFSAGALYPCYGLAEATLMVSGPGRGSGAVITDFNDTALSRNCIEPMSDGMHSSRLVACGAPVGATRVLIVDSQTHRPAAPQRVGEIWVAGASVSQGYWQKPGLTQSSFNARLSETEKGPFFRTGDLGFLWDDQLYITGRRDDLIIVRGLNRYPQDIEATARRSHPLLEAGTGAAFTIGDNGSQRLVLIHEVRRNGSVDFTPVLQAVCTAVLDDHDLSLDGLVLVRSGTIPRTSSGKIQRHACRAAYLAGDLKILAEYPDPAAAATDDCCAFASPDAVCDSSAIAHHDIHSLPPDAFFAVCRHARDLAKTALPYLTPDMPLSALGLDSLQRLGLVAELEKAFSGHLPDAVFCQAKTLGDVAQGVQKYLIDNRIVGAPVGPIMPEYYTFDMFPEYLQLKRHESMLRAVTGEIPYFRVDQGGDGSAAHIDGRSLVNFCVYDYIGMAHDPEVLAAAKAAIDRYGTSAGASRLVSGEKQVHRDLEQELAGFLGVPAAIAFVSGHATNVTTIGHLLGPDDLILHDTLAHNSIIQGAELSGATHRAFAHNDWMALDAMLCESRHRYRRVLIAIEGVYSMDGDLPELPRFIALKKKHKTLILVDEAHSLGTLGATGRGIGEHWAVARSDVDLWMGTLSKSLASCGGYIAGSAELVEYLKYTAPGFVYSVGMPPPSAAAALASLKVLQREPQRVVRLHELTGLFLDLAKKHGLNTGSAAGSPVIPVIVGNSVKSLQLSNALFDRGINVLPILSPAVPDHSSRLRFFITTNHSVGQIRDAVQAVADELAKLQRQENMSRRSMTNPAEHAL